MKVVGAQRKVRSENSLSVFVRYYCSDKTKDGAVWNKCLMWEKCETHKTGVQKFLLPGRRGDYILYSGPKYLCNLSVKLVHCHHSGAKKFEKASRILENLCVSGIKYFNQKT